MKKIIHLVVFLGILSAIAGGLLSYINSLTAPVIEANSLAAETATLKVVFPNTTDFEKLDFTDDSGIVDSVYLAGTDGYAFKCTNIGFNTSTPIELIVALDQDGNTVGFQIVNHQETSGIGDVIESDSFSDNVIGRSLDEDIDLVSGATYSSTAVLEAIRTAKDVFTTLDGVAAIEQSVLFVNGEVSYE